MVSVDHERLTKHFDSGKCCNCFTNQITNVWILKLIKMLIFISVDQLFAIVICSFTASILLMNFLCMFICVLLGFIFLGR